MVGGLSKIGQNHYINEIIQRGCKLKPPAKFSYEATRFFIAEKLLSFVLFTAIRRSSTQLKISLNPNLLSIQALLGH
jgi:hypothetical protein